MQHVEERQGRRPSRELGNDTELIALMWRFFYGRTTGLILNP